MSAVGIQYRKIRCRFPPTNKDRLDLYTIHDDCSRCCTTVAHRSLLDMGCELKLKFNHIPSTPHSLVWLRSDGPESTGWFLHSISGQTPNKMIIRALDVLAHAQTRINPRLIIIRCICACSVSEEFDGDVQLCAFAHFRLDGREVSIVLAAKSAFDLRLPAACLY